MNSWTKKHSRLLEKWADFQLSYLDFRTSRADSLRAMKQLSLVQAKS